MPRAHRLEQDFSTAQRTFDTAAMTVGGLYITTHSVIVTVVGTAAGSLLACWVLWLARRGQAAADRERRLPASSQSTKH